MPIGCPFYKSLLGRSIPGCNFNNTRCNRSIFIQFPLDNFARNLHFIICRYISPWFSHGFPCFPPGFPRFFSHQNHHEKLGALSIATGVPLVKAMTAGPAPDKHLGTTRRTGKTMGKSWENLGNPWDAKKTPCSMANKSKKIISQ